jgi:hypothetical protein
MYDRRVIATEDHVVEKHVLPEVILRLLRDHDWRLSLLWWHIGHRLRAIIAGGKNHNCAADDYQRCYCNP